MAAEERQRKKGISVLKRVRQSKKRRMRNRAVKSKISTLTKKLEEALTKNDGPEDAVKYLRDVTRELDKASSKGILHRKTTSRQISRLSKKTTLFLKSAAA